MRNSARDLALIVIFALPLVDLLLVRVSQGLQITRGRNAPAEALVMEACLLDNEKSMRIKCELPYVQENRSYWESREGSEKCENPCQQFLFFYTSRGVELWKKLTNYGVLSPNHETNITR